MTTPSAEDYAQQARDMAAKNAIINAIHLYGHAMHAAPDDIRYKNEFIYYLQTKNLRIISNTLKSLMVECLAHPGTDWLRAGYAWQSLMLADPAFKPLPKLLKIEKYPKFVKAITAASTAPLFNDLYFLYGVARVTVPTVAFERFLTFLRRYLLEQRQTKNLPLSIAYVLARYCHRTEYVFYVTDEEKALLSNLASTEEDQVLLACYQPIQNADIVQGASQSWKDLANEQTQARKIIQQHRGTINRITPISDDISLLVQSQYEKYPYPAWDTAKPGFVNEGEKAAAGKPGALILNAGCGTGKEAIELALTYPQADVLAVDLSTASLAYAQAKAQQYALKNISFGQADILQIAATGKEFDFIASSGVLHHMKSPYDGWAALKSVLKPGGLMRVALYSETARQSINEARNVIQKKAITASDDDIRRFRHDMKNILRGKTWKKITEFYDYFFLNECCDLLFHAQELQFTPLLIDDHLKRLNLQFEGFYLPARPSILYRKKFPGDPNAINLANWEKFEKKNPDTFRDMYVFWCRNTPA